MSAQPNAQGRIEHKQAKFYRDGEEIDVQDVEYTIDEEWERMTGDTEAADLNEYYAKIYRTRDGKRHYLFRALPSDFPISDRIRDTYGTGEYEVWMMRKNKIAARMSKAIEAPPDWKAPSSEPEKINESAAIVASIEKLGDLFLKAQAAAPGTVIAPAGTPPLDPIAMQQNMLGVMLQAKELFSPNAAPTNATTTAMEAFIKGVELAKDLAGGSGETNLLDVFMKMAEPDGVFTKLTDLAEQQQNALTSPKALVDATGKPIPQATATGPTPEQRQAQMKGILQAQLAFMLNQAKAGKSPELYAEVVLDQWPESLVVDFVAKPDAIQQMIALNPEVANHEQWFREVGDAVLRMVGPEGGNGDVIPNGETDAPKPHTNSNAQSDTERPGGDTGNT